MLAVQKKRRRSTAKPTVINLQRIDIKNQIHLNPLYSNKEKAYKMVNITRRDKPGYSPVLLAFQATPGRIPKFGVGVNAYGKMNFTFPVEGKEYEKVLEIEEFLITEGQKRADSWWGKGKIRPDQVRENFASIISRPKPKTNDPTQFWPANMSAKIPASAEGVIEDWKCSIKNEDGETVNPLELNGKTYLRVVVELNGLYFQGKRNWGVTKTVRVIKVSNDVEEKGAFVANEQVGYDDLSDESDSEETPVQTDSSTTTQTPGTTKSSSKKRKTSSSSSLGRKKTTTTELNLI